MKRRIVIDLDIDLNDTPEDYIDWGLDKAINHLFADGWMTGTLNAELNEWDYRIEDPEKITDNDKH